MTVSISTAPGSGAAAYAVEDQFPAGWTVTNISHSGELDSVNGKVKWGPFLDSTPRVLTYQITPPRTGSGLANFSGLISFDGASLPVAGRQPLSESCLLQVDRQNSPSEFQFIFRGRAGGNFIFETSTDLANWTHWCTVSNTHGGLWFITLIQPETPHRFFRARLAEQ